MRSHAVAIVAGHPHLTRLPRMLARQLSARLAADVSLPRQPLHRPCRPARHRTTLETAGRVPASTRYRRPAHDCGAGQQGVVRARAGGDVGPAGAGHPIEVFAWSRLPSRQATQPASESLYTLRSSKLPRGALGVGVNGSVGAPGGCGLTGAAPACGCVGEKRASRAALASWVPKAEREDSAITRETLTDMA